MYRDRETLSFELMDANYDARNEQDAERVTYPKWEEPLSEAEQARIEAEELALAAEAAVGAAAAPAALVCESGNETRQGFRMSVSREEDAPTRYTVTMTSEQYQIIYGAVLTAEIAFGSKGATAPLALSREFAAQDHAKAQAAMAVLESLNYRMIEEAA